MKKFEKIINNIINGNKKDASNAFYALDAESKRDFMSYLVENINDKENLIHHLRALFIQ